jgi:translocation protein SEC63
MTGQKMATFDPYEVLELEKGASMMEIKRAYRSQSLIWHPDKHQGDKNAEERFVLISKAHQVLTDPTSRENFEKYGNADGMLLFQFSLLLLMWTINVQFFLILDQAIKALPSPSACLHFLPTSATSS